VIKKTESEKKQKVFKVVLAVEGSSTQKTGGDRRLSHMGRLRGSLLSGLKIKGLPRERVRHSRKKILVTGREGDDSESRHMQVPGRNCRKKRTEGACKAVRVKYKKWKSHKASIRSVDRGNPPGKLKKWPEA